MPALLAFWIPRVLAADADLDGLGDAQEIGRGTDPADSDTDGDELPDGAEVRVLGTDPLDHDGHCQPWGRGPYLGSARDVALADLDGDGISEVVVLRQDGAVEWAEMGALDGSWARIRAAYDPGDHLAAADLDGDGLAEVVVWDDGEIGSAWLYRPQIARGRDPGGAHYREEPLQFLDGISDILLTDLDGDGWTDVLAGGESALAWRRNDRGVLAPEAPLVPSTPYRWVHEVVVADLDGDTLLDLAFISGYLDYDPSTVVWARQIGPLQFDADDLGGYAVPQLDVADVDGVPPLDLVFVESGRLRTRLGGPGGPGAKQVVWNDVERFTVADLDGDRDDDLVVSNDDGLWWLERELSGGLDGRSLIEDGFGPRRTWAADLDGDRDGDLLYLVPPGGTFSLLRNKESDDDDGDRIGAGAERCAMGTRDDRLDSDGGGTWDLAELWAPSDPADPSDDLALPDSDGDRIPDVLELALLASDPEAADTDGDGSPDPTEWARGTDPTDEDTDGDGLTDGDEAGAATDPLDPDSDDDRLTDGAEVGLGTDPLDADSDDDRLSDADELDRYGSDPTASDPDGDVDDLPDVAEQVEGTDPSRPDTDDDGAWDGEEVSAGSSPLDPDTDADGVPDGAELWWLGTDPRWDERDCAPWPVTPIDDGPSITLQVADLDGNGLADALVSTMSGVRRFELTSARTAIELPPLSTSGEGHDLLVADLDADLDLDVVWSSTNAPYLVHWAEQRPDHGFAPPVLLDDSYQAKTGIAAADLDGDGLLDLLLSLRDADQVVVRRNLGQGAFAAAEAIASLDGPGDLDLADLDADGDLDLLVAASELPDLTRSGVDLFENLGGGVFGPPERISGPGYRVGAAAGDLDGDGDLDLATSGHLTLWLEQVAPHTWIDHVVADRSDAVQLGDLDGDGDLDLLLQKDLDLELWRWDGAGLARWRGLALNGQHDQVRLHDLDDDGDSDLVSALSGLDLVEAIGQADADADGLTEGAERCISLTDPLRSDTDGGGQPDLAELWDLTDPLDPADDGAHAPLELVVIDAPGAGALNLFEVRGADPGATIDLAGSFAPGSTPLGGCPRERLELRDPRRLAVGRADARGVARLQLPVPDELAGVSVWLQAVHRPSCRTSRSLSLEL